MTLNVTSVPLTHRLVTLEPLHEDHGPALLAAKAEDAERSFAWWPRPMATARDREEHLAWQFEEVAAGRWLIWTVMDPGGRVVGQTCYLNIVPEHERLEVGGTWYVPSVRGTAINPAAKLLMLGHAFACGAGRVELKTDGLNAPSRAAILKMGATFEGVFRRHMLMPGDRWRDTAWYAVLHEDWPTVRAGLERRLEAF